MRFHAFIRVACAVLASLLLATCGGGGAKQDPNRGGTLDINPGSTNGPAATFYAGVIYTMTIQGGIGPYSLTSTEPALLPVPSTPIKGPYFDVVGANPGVVDAGIPAGQLQFRSVTITVRDSLGNFKQSLIHLAQNFLTGYNAFFQPSTCPTGAQACGGGETIVQFDTITNGILYGNRPFTVSMVQGQCLFENPLGSTTLTSSVTSSTDHQGKLVVALRCPSGVASEVDILRVMDVQSGASTVFAFNVSQASASQSIEAVPSTFTFTGPDSATCGTGDADFFVFGGQPPYSAVSSQSNITVTPTSNSQPGKFTVGAHDPTTCVDSTIIVTDARLGKVTVEVKTVAGSAPPPAPVVPLSATPSALTLTCAQSGSVIVTGGSGTLSAASTDPNIGVAVGTSTVTITRNGTLPVTDPTVVTSTVNVTDGTSIVTISVSNPKGCT